MKVKTAYRYTLPDEVQEPIIKLQKVPMTTKWEDFAHSMCKLMLMLVFIILYPLKWTLDALLGSIQAAYLQFFTFFEAILKVYRTTKGPFHEINSTINYMYLQQPEDAKKEVKQVTNHRYTIVLELKDVLVKINPQNARSGSKDHRAIHASKLKDLQILKRKNLVEFLKNVSELGKLVLWSSLSKEVTDFILDSAGIQSYFSQVLYEDACLREGKGLIKNASIISEDLSQVIMVDHSFASHARNPDNILYVPEFQINDDALLRILAGIQALHEREITDVRSYLHYILR